MYFTSHFGNTYLPTATPGTLQIAPIRRRMHHRRPRINRQPSSTLDDEVDLRMGKRPALWSYWQSVLPHTRVSHQTKQRAAHVRPPANAECYTASPYVSAAMLTGTTRATIVDRRVRLGRPPPQRSTKLHKTRLILSDSKV